MSGKPHWHTQMVSRDPERGHRRNPYGPVTRRWEVNRTSSYRTRAEARRAVSLDHNVIIRCTNPMCAPGAGA